MEEALLSEKHLPADQATLEFEREALAVMIEEGSALAWQKFGTRWELGPEELATTQAYYRLLRQENAGFNLEASQGTPRSYDPTADLQHLGVLGRKRFFAENPAAKVRFDYYQSHLSLLSVPEMAQELGSSERKVRRELSEFKLSVVEAFAGNYGEGERPASVFVRHYLQLKDRGVSWQRRADFEGKDLSENEILRILHSRELPTEEIARVLNQLFATSAVSPGLRTEGSITERKRELGLVQFRPHVVKDFDVTGYGTVKKNGVLLVAPASRFIFENREKGHAWIAHQLGVHVDSLKAFNRRHHLEGLFKRNIRSEIAAERAALESKYISHLLTTRNLLLTGDATKWTSQMGVSLEKAFAYGAYSETGGQHSLRLYDGLSEFYQEVEARLPEELARHPGIAEPEAAQMLEKMSALSTRQQLSDLAFVDRQQITMKSILDYMLSLNPPQFPRTTPKKEFQKAAGVNYEKWTGQGYWDSALGHESQPLNPTTLEAYENFLDYAEAYFDAHPVDSEKKLAIVRSVEEKIAFHEKANLSPLKKNLRVFENLYVHLKENEGFPSSRQQEWLPVAEFGYINFTTEYNRSPAQAFKRFHRWLKAKVLHDEDLSPEKRQRLLVISERKSFDVEFESYDFEKQRAVAASRIVHRLIDSGRYPADKKLKEETGIASTRFYGTGEYRRRQGLNIDTQAAFVQLQAVLELELLARGDLTELQRGLLRAELARARASHRR